MNGLTLFSDHFRTTNLTKSLCLLDFALQLSGGNLDFEIKNEYSMNVTVTDNGEPPMSNTFPITIWVNDQNDAPYNLQLVGELTTTNHTFHS